MNLLDQIRTINKSATAATLAGTFLVGYLVPITTMVLPHFCTTDYVEAWRAFYRDELCNRTWLYLFFKATLNSGIAAVLGTQIKTQLYDRFKTYFLPNPTT